MKTPNPSQIAHALGLMREHRRKYGPDSPFFNESDEAMRRYAINKLQLGYLPSVEGINAFAVRKEFEAMKRSPGGLQIAPNGKEMLAQHYAELDGKRPANAPPLSVPPAQFPDKETPAQKLARANDAAVKKWLGKP